MRISLSVAAGMIAVGICSSASAGSPPILPVTLVHSGNGGQALVAGYNNIDSVNLTCVRMTGCQLLTFSMASLANYDSGQWQICTFVDGVLVGLCPEQGKTHGGGAMAITGTAQATTAISHGPHSVQTEVYVIKDVTLGPWQVNYLRYAFLQ